MEEHAVERLEAKSPEEAIIERIGRDFNLAPFMARTQFEQMRRYFEHYLGLERDVGQISEYRVSAGISRRQCHQDSETSVKRSSPPTRASRITGSAKLKQDP